MEEINACFFQRSNATPFNVLVIVNSDITTILKNFISLLTVYFSVTKAVYVATYCVLLPDPIVVSCISMYTTRTQIDTRIVLFINLQLTIVGFFNQSFYTMSCIVAPVLYVCYIFSFVFFI